MRKIVLFLVCHIVHHCIGQIPTDELGLWLRADKDVAGSGTGVLSWKDQSGHSANAVTATVNGPLLIPGAVNGRPSIRFDGINNGMVTPPMNNFPAKRGTLVMVSRINGRSATSGVGVGSLLSTFHGNGVVWQFCANTEKFSFFDGTNAESFGVMNHSATGWCVTTIMRTDDSTVKFYLDGRFERSVRVSDKQPDINSLKIGFNGRLGGSSTDSIPEVLNGDIAEIIMYNKALGKSELDQVHNYLSVKYGLALRPPPVWERWWFYGLIILLFFLLVLLVMQFIAQQKLKKKLKEIEKQREMDKERQRISREMHDDIGAGLTQITLMSESAKIRLSGENKKELDDIAETSRRLVSSMSEIIWSLNPENKTLEHLLNYLREQLYKQFEYSGINHVIDLPETGSEIALTNEQRRNILLITKEIVNNAIKYSGADTISVKLTLQAGFLTGVIEDNGNGFDISKKYTGNGLKNIRFRVEELSGKLQVSSETGKGSRFEYSVPI